jgi:hypothetical protein
MEWWRANPSPNHVPGNLKDLARFIHEGDEQVVFAGFY